MPGYSGTPLPVKLGVKDNFRVAAVDMPPDVSALLSGAIAACIKTSKAPLDCAMLFVKTRAQLAKQFSGIASALAPAGMLWVAWPKQTSGVPTDLNENEVRRIGLEAGLVDVKVCAITEIWSGLKFVIRLKDRSSKTRARGPKVTP
ncbi:MAG: DUF3052 family protein [Acidobacteriales bacterium]|nr:DUF3052 family protein [Terriglobales bacterium]